MHKIHFCFLHNNTYDYIFKNDIKPILIKDGTYNEDTLLDYLYSISLIHKPDEFDDINSSNLTLAGHSLGGQIRLPLYGALIKKKGANKYFDEYYNHDTNIMYVSYGIGVEKTHLRLNNAPSINVYRLIAK